VQQVLGHLDDTRLLALFDVVLTKSPHDFLQFTTDHNLHVYSADFLWRTLIELTRAALWIKYGVTPNQFVDHVDTLQNIVTHVSKTRLTLFLEMLYTNELHFLKTTAQYPLLEMILLQLCQKNETGGSSGTPSQIAVSRPAEDTLEYLSADDDCDDYEDDQGDDEDEDTQTLQGDVKKTTTDASYHLVWNQFLARMESCKEPLVTSILKQGAFASLGDNKVTVNFSKELSFFIDSLHAAKAVWEPELKELFGQSVSLDPHFTQAPTPKVMRSPVVTHVQSAEQPSQTKAPIKSVGQQYLQRSSYGSNFSSNQAPKINEPRIDISDKNLWKMTHLVLQYFPGTVTQTSEKSV
jgi:DNA polymerase III gamma/tau subunit